MKQQIETASAAETENLAQKIGSNLQGGEIIELVSDVGGGKTTFVRGLAKGAGSVDAVASPTFTVSRVYETDMFIIHHFDLYRIQEAGLLEHELEEIIEDRTDVVVVEWGNTIAHVLPKNRLIVTIENIGEEKRKFLFEAPKTLTYLLGSL